MIENTLADLAGQLQLNPQLLQLALLLVAGLLLHFLLALALRRLHRLAHDTSVMRWDDVLITALGGPVRLVLWVVVAYLALDVYPVTDGLQAHFTSALDTALILLVAWFGVRLIRGVAHELLDRQAPGASSDRATIQAVAKLLRIALYILASLMVLQTLGVSVSGLLAFGGIGGIAVGFAAKDLLANFFGGLSIYLDRPFATGDWIRSPDRQIEGTVEDIGWRLTRIRTFDQRPLYVPNAVFSQIAVENPSRMFNRRIYETIGLRYEDAARVAPVVEQVRAMLEEHPDLDLSRTLIVNFVSFGASSLDFFIYTFTRTTNWVEYHGIKQDIMLRIIDIVHANGADIAFPTTTVHMAQEPAAPAQ